MPVWRLQKFLAAAGVCSRRAAEKLIVGGQIKVNGRVAKELGVKIDTEKDRVYFKNKRIKSPERKIYLALNKPVGVISSCRSYKEKTVLDFLPFKERLYPVGRLDKNSSGLMIITNDGELALKLTHPRYAQEKEYLVVLDKKIKIKDLRVMEEGIILNKKKTLPAEIKQEGPNKFRIILWEGRKRQLREMCHLLSYGVAELQRVRIKNITLDNLKPGEWRRLNQSELNKLTKNL